MLIYYKFQVTPTATVGVWAVTEDDARETVAKIEKCPEHVPQLIQTRAEVTLENLEQGELI
jgi:hypothetical protein